MADAKGKLVKLEKRAQKIYVDYLAGWGRAKNYIHKLSKMQQALMKYLDKCGYNKKDILKLQESWEVDQKRY